MEAKAFREQIIRPALQIVDLWSQAAENLLVGTALVETGLEVVRQMGSGPALSFFQIEPTTYDDVVKYLGRNRDMRDRILAACYMEMFPPADCSTWNMRLATYIARVVYYRRPEKLPLFSDYEGLCNYYLKYYNTRLGKSTFEKSISHFKEACRN